MSKAITISALLLLTVFGLYAQDSSMVEYKGKYKMNAGPISEVEVAGDSTALSLNSAMGSVSLTRAEGDVFNMVEVSGTVTFTRNADNKVAGIRISVMGRDLEGTKESFANNGQGLHIRPLSLRSLPYGLAFIPTAAAPPPTLAPPTP